MTHNQCLLKLRLTYTEASVLHIASGSTARIIILFLGNLCVQGEATGLKESRLRHDITNLLRDCTV